MVVTLADCLQEYLRTGSHREIVRDQIKFYVGELHARCEGTPADSRPG